MDGLRDVLETVRTAGLAAGHLQGLIHVCIGRTISTADGRPVSKGVTWRELAGLFKQLRFDPELVREIGADPEDLSPRDRQRYWYTAIALARPDSAETVTAGDRFAVALKPLGYAVGPPPRGLPAAPSAPPSTPDESPKKSKPTPTPPVKKKK